MNIQSDGREKEKTEQNIPKCIGVILDGNRRWARENGLPDFEGHRRGYTTLKAFLGWARGVGVENVIVYAFSTENWHRAEEEVIGLFGLFRAVFEDILSEALHEETRLYFLGDIERLPEDIQKSITRAEDETNHFQTRRLGVALSYGGRAEILAAIKKMAPDDIGGMTEEKFSQLLYTRDFPDPDMIIRTSGEQRLSNFLPWQSVYSELFFTPTCWPAFTKEEFYTILGTFSQRKRRRGK